MNFNQICVWAPIYLVIFVIAYMEIMMIYIFINPEATEIVLMILHHLLLLVVIYLFFKTITTQPGTPTYQYTEDDPLVEWRKICKHCQIKKPLRCHHCAACNKCILRMSNHSFWLNNCIGQKNYKYFFCLLFYLKPQLQFFTFLFFQLKLQKFLLLVRLIHILQFLQFFQALHL
ncbi:unnamed protein product [Paramecium pentaurelia]|uniref:Palmitoyltransferase n=1 Tax=Paramecium pentaurelia TaxID=43138 RepID=A0A8S1TNH3_9CILI|nr:unnamed protein product [Paramecium pentaurelia]